MNSPPWNLSRYIRAAIISRDLPLTEETATAERIEEIASNLAENGHDEIAGYDIATVRTILLDKSVTSPHAPEAPDRYAGK